MLAHYWENIDTKPTKIVDLGQVDHFNAWINWDTFLRNLRHRYPYVVYSSLQAYISYP